jgi:Rrf2 family protein
MISTTADYAVRAVIQLARLPEQGALPADVIAKALGAPANYLAKTLNLLAKAGILISRRGPTGGFALAIRPAQLTIAAVMQPFAEEPRTAHCLQADRSCNHEAPCAAHALWRGPAEQALAAYARTTIAELLACDLHEARPPLTYARFVTPVGATLSLAG